MRGERESPTTKVQQERALGLIDLLAPLIAIAEMTEVTTEIEEMIAATTGTGEMTVGKETTHQSPQPSNFCSEKNLSQLLFF